ncbi:MAG: fumarylacetoacetase [Alphaproteobacteria bacterium]
MSLIYSWVETANKLNHPFPLNNLPCGVFWSGKDARCCVAIGDFVLDVSSLEKTNLLSLLDAPLFDEPAWNKLMAAGSNAWSALRQQLTALLAKGSAERRAIEPFLVPMSAVQMKIPFRVSEYTDFYAGRHHAFNVGAMFRGPENALPPNWLHIPIGYNGRASSVVVSGTPVRRPWGQVKGPSDDVPRFAPSRRFDIELEMGAVVALPSTNGRPVTVAEADNMIFGYVLLNDWSARDIQAWEYQPLGPFQAKATATTISPWIVMKTALEPFRVSTPKREVPLLPYLHEDRAMLYDIALEISLVPDGGSETIISRTNYREMYYSAAQQLAHHTTSGCAMNTGDLLGSGTISGSTKNSQGSLLELSWGGKEPFQIAGGTRSFIEDKDTLILRGYAQGDGYRIGFGECTGQVIPALTDPYGRT